MTERMVDSGTSGERSGHDSRPGDEQQGTTPVPAPRPAAAATAPAARAAPATAPRPEAQPAPVTAVPFEVWASRFTGALPGALRRVPFTATVVLVTLIVGVVARTVWIADLAGRLVPPRSPTARRRCARARSGRC